MPVQQMHSSQSSQMPQSLSQACSAINRVSGSISNRPHQFRSSRQRGSQRAGLTLTEILIAVTVTLVLMAALVNAFKAISDEISESRAILELAGQLRNSGETIREDLRGVTAPASPWVDPAEGMGYLEIAEFSTAGMGYPAAYYPNRAYNIDPSRPDNLQGDIDDVVMFTARSEGKPFRGRIRQLNGALRTIESPVAEIAIWTALVDNNGNGVLDRDIGEYITVHRRVLLVRPDLNNDPAIFPAVGQVAGNNDALTWYQNNDVSVHLSPNGLVANSLGDLSKREHRFAHFVGAAPGAAIADISANAFPYPISRTWLNALVLTGNFRGEDVLMADAVTFDVKVFDPRAPIYSDLHVGGSGVVGLTQGDPVFESLILADAGGVGTYGFANSPGIDEMTSRGTYVDLGYLYNMSRENPAIAGALDGVSEFSGPPLVKSQMGNDTILAAPGEYPLLVFDTWPVHYESDGLNQDRQFRAYGNDYNDVDVNGDPLTTLVDEGSDGMDNFNDAVGLNGVAVGSVMLGADDASERETAPPYAKSLRGIEITLRVIEPTSQQVRQSSVVVDFVGLE